MFIVWESNQGSLEVAGRCGDSYGAYCGSRPCGLYMEVAVALAQSLNNERLGDNFALRLQSVIILLSVFRGVRLFAGYIILMSLVVSLGTLLKFCV